MIVTTGMLAEMRRMYAEGASYADISRKVGVSPKVVDYWMRVKGGEGWREANARRWAERLASVDGLPDSAAARKLGCDRVTVYRWRRRLGL